MRRVPALLLVVAMNAAASPAGDEKAVYQLDVEYQNAVKMNDPLTLRRIHAENMVLVTGRGKVFTAAELEAEARKVSTRYEQQDVIEGTRKVRVWGDTAVVTGLLWIKGTSAERGAFDYKLWFSDTYVRTEEGWRYVFGQASLPLPRD